MLIFLEKMTDRKMSRDETSFYTRSQNNIHELESLTPDCVFINLLIRPSRQDKRSWYFPVPFSVSEERGLYNRVLNKASVHPV